MAKYRVLYQTLIGDRVYGPGEEVEYDGKPAGNLEPIDAAAKKAVKEAERHFAEERAARQLASNPEAAAMAAATVDEFEKRSRGTDKVGFGGQDLQPSPSVDEERASKAHK